MAARATLKNTDAKFNPYKWFCGSERGRFFFNTCYDDYYTNGLNSHLPESILNSKCWALLKAAHFSNQEKDMTVDDLHWEVTDFVIQTALFHRELDNSSNAGICLMEVKRSIFSETLNLDNNKLDIIVTQLKNESFVENFMKGISINMTTKDHRGYIVRHVTVLDKNIAADLHKILVAMRSQDSKNPIDIIIQTIGNVCNDKSQLANLEYNANLQIAALLEQNINVNITNIKEKFARMIQAFVNLYKEGKKDEAEHYKTTVILTFLNKDILIKEMQQAIFDAAKTALKTKFRLNEYTTLANSQQSKDLYENVYRHWNKLSEREKHFYQANLSLLKKDPASENWVQVEEAEYGDIKSYEYSSYRFNLNKRHGKIVFATTLPKLIQKETPHIWYTPFDYKDTRRHAKVGIKGSLDKELMAILNEFLDKESKMSDDDAKKLKQKLENTGYGDVANMLVRDNSSYSYVSPQMGHNEMHVAFDLKSNDSRDPPSYGGAITGRGTYTNIETYLKQESAPQKLTQSEYKDILSELYTQVYEAPYSKQSPKISPMSISLYKKPFITFTISASYEEFYDLSDVSEFSFELQKVVRNLLHDRQDCAHNMTGGFSFSPEELVWRDKEGKIHYRDADPSQEKCFGLGVTKKCNEIIQKCVLNDETEKCIKMILEDDSVFAEALASIESLDLRIALKMLDNFQFKTIGDTSVPGCNLNRKETVMEWSSRIKREMPDYTDVNKLLAKTNFVKFLEAVVTKINSHRPILNATAMTNNKIDCEKSWLAKIGIPQRVESLTGNSLKLGMSAITGSKPGIQEGGYGRDLNTLPGLLTGGAGSVVLTSPIPLGAHSGMIIKNSLENSGHIYLEKIMERSINALKSRNLRLEDSDYKTIKKQMEEHKKLEEDLIKKLSVLEKYNKFLRDLSIDQMGSDAKKQMKTGEVSYSALETLTNEVEVLQEEYRKNEYKMAGIIGGIGNLLLYR